MASEGAKLEQINVAQGKAEALNILSEALSHKQGIYSVNLCSLNLLELELSVILFFQILNKNLVCPKIDCEFLQLCLCSSLIQAFINSVLNFHNTYQ